MDRRRRGPLAAALLVALLCGLAWLPAVDAPGRDYVDASLADAAAVFATARAINAGLSVLQGTEVAASPFGLGLTLAVGEVLDPANDLIERFSWVVLASVASLGVQKLLAEAAGHVLLAGLLTLAGVVMVIALFRGGARFRAIARRAFVLALVLRFAMPVAGLLSAGADRLFLAEQFSASAAELEGAGEALDRDLDRLEGPPESYRDRFARWLGADDGRDRLKELADYAGSIVDAIGRLIALFALKSLLLPLAFIWAFVRATKSLASPLPHS